MATIDPNIALLSKYADLLGYDTSKLSYQRSTDGRGGAGTYYYGKPGFSSSLGAGYGQQATDVSRTVNDTLKGLQPYERSLSVKDSQGRLAYGTTGNISGALASMAVNLPGITQSWSMNGDGRSSTPNSGFMVTKDYFGGLKNQFEKDHPGYIQAPLNDKGEPDAPRIWAFEDPNTIKYDPKYGYIIPKENFHPTSDGAIERYGKYVPIALFGAGVAAGALGGGAAAGGSGTATASGVGASGSTTLGAASTGTGLSSAGAGTGLASGAGTFNGIGLGSGLGSGGLVGGTAATGTATGTGTFFGISGAGATSGALGTTAVGGIGASSLGSGSGISTGGTAAQGLGIPSAGYPGAGVTATGGLSEGGTLSGTYGTGASTANPGFAGTTGGLGSNTGLLGTGVTGEQLLSGIKTGQQVLGAVGAAGGGQGAAGDSGGSGAPVTPHDVTWTPWTSPTSAFKAQTQAVPAQSLPLQFQPAQNYQQLRQQQDEYNAYITDQLQRSRNQRMGL